MGRAVRAVGYDLTIICDALNEVPSGLIRPTASIVASDVVAYHWR